MIRKLLFITIIAITVISAASATNVSVSRAVTCEGPSGMLVPLGIENVIPLSDALTWYNWISSGIILLVAAVASKRNFHYIALTLPMVAAIVTWFGWLQTNDTGQTWSIIIAFALLGVGIYFKQQLKESFGIGGPGSTLMSLVVFMILLSAVFGMVNSSGIWKDNVGVASEEFSNVNLESEITSISNTGGWLDSVINSGTAFVTAAISSLKILVTMMMSIAFFSAAIVLMYPWLMASPIAIAILGIMQTAIWILYAKIFVDIMYFKNIFSMEL